MPAPCNFDHNGECLVCDAWPSDCAWQKLMNRDFTYQSETQLVELFYPYMTEEENKNHTISWLKQIVKMKKIPKIVCPSCKRTIYGGVAPWNEQKQAPTHGDYSVCAACGAFCRYEISENMYRLKLLDAFDILQLQKTNPKAFSQLSRAAAAIKTTPKPNQKN